MSVRRTVGNLDGAAFSTSGHELVWRRVGAKDSAVRRSNSKTSQLRGITHRQRVESHGMNLCVHLIGVVAVNFTARLASRCVVNDEDVENGGHAFAFCGGFERVWDICTVCRVCFHSAS